jgi:hypothetical protein
MANPSDAQLRRWYLKLNAELWAGLLPADTILALLQHKTD